MLTAPQMATLKAAILADATANAFPNTQDGNFALAAYLNTVPGSPTSLWRPDVAPNEITATITFSAFVGLTAIRQNGLLLMTQGPVDATKATVRTGFQDIFGAGATLTALTALAQRPGTRFEVIFSSVSGAASVSTMYGVRADYQDVMAARNS